MLVVGECSANLHSAWDTCLVLKAVGEDVGEAATELLKTITPARIESWTHSAPMDWAHESFAIAEQARTEYCIRRGASRDHPSGKVKIDTAYVAVNTPIVREQLQKAGVRLAHLLDAPGTIKTTLPNKASYAELRQRAQSRWQEESAIPVTRAQWDTLSSGLPKICMRYRGPTGEILGELSKWKETAVVGAYWCDY